MLTICPSPSTSLYTHLLLPVLCPLSHVPCHLSPAACQELIAANKNVEFEFHLPEWGGVSAEAKDWICRALLPGAAERMTPIKAKNHPWLASLRA